MKLKPNFIRTVDKESMKELPFDINVMFIESREPVDGHLSEVVVSGRKHYVFTSELKEFVSLPNDRRY